MLYAFELKETAGAGNSDWFTALGAWAVGAGFVVVVTAGAGTMAEPTAGVLVMGATGADKPVDDELATVEVFDAAAGVDVVDKPVPLKPAGIFSSGVT